MTGRIFVKEAQSAKAAGAEVEGLEALASVLAELDTTLATPGIYAQRDFRLELSAVERRNPTQALWRAAGRGLALLHSEPQLHFGWHRDNFIGLNPQRNEWRDDWGTFFVDFRLGVQLDWFSENSNAQEYEAILSRQRGRLIEYLNASVRHPSLVHGDLWIGNLLFDAHQPWLIDPAVYVADAEVDIAMTQMFGGFSDAFYQAYREIRPAPPDCERRHQLYNLYHALNHANLFGRGYFGLCQQGFELIEEL